MPELATLLPCRRPELTIRPLDAGGQHVVKDPRTGEFYCLGPVEHFLLLQLDGEQTAEEVAAAFERQFGEPLGEADLEEFLDLAQSQGLLAESGDGVPQDRGTEEQSEGGNSPGDVAVPARSSVPPSLRPSVGAKQQSILYWRKNLFDPDRLFTWLAPRIGFFWTRGFLVLSVGSILLATVVLWTSRYEVAGSFTTAIRWESVVVVWLTLFVVTMLHESAHGLTCKHYGGEVHEIGFLLMYFMPCFYCNVSDAWLFREKSKRLWVTFAGGYFELLVWSLAVFVWRLTLSGSWPNYLAFIVVSACGVQTLFNFNPFIKLDGYYLLSDWLEIPNLSQRASRFLKSQMRWLLWGAPRSAEQRPAALLSYGLVSWLYSLAFLGLMVFGLGRLFTGRWGIFGLAAAGLLVIPIARHLFSGLITGEVAMMILRRHKRTACWALCLTALAAASFIELDDRVGGACQLRATARSELRAPVTGFITEVRCDEGDSVGTGQLVLHLHVPDLDSRIAQKQAEVRESQARLRELETGARPEELAEQRQRVRRAQEWRDLSAEDLQHARQAFAAESSRLDHSITRSRAALEAARHRFQRTEKLAPKGAVTKDEYEQIQLELRVAESDGDQLLAAKSAHQAKGTRDSEAELARREKELADERGKLALMEAGTRQEQIDAEQARHARLEEELSYLQGIQSKLLVTCPHAGVITTPHLKEKIGQYVREGDLLCLIEEPGTMEAEIALDEQRLEHVKAGQAVFVKLRTVPLATYAARVERVAPTAVKTDSKDPQAHVTVYCRVDACLPDLRPGMTGYARVSTGRRSLGTILTDRALRLLRTEFWL